MKYARLGRTGLKVSRLCLGTMNFGPHTTERDGVAIRGRAARKRRGPSTDYWAG